MDKLSPLDQVAPFPVLLAPMVGLSHFVVRKAIQEHLPAGERSMWPTEMLNSRRLPSQKMGQNIETRFDDAEAGLCPQLLGNEESFIRDSIAKLREWGARAIDINMGCPVKKALSHNYGVALMGDPDYAAEVTAMAVKHSQGLPVSVKFRAALSETNPEFLKRFCLGIQDAGASWITLHPRTAEQKRRGDADWSQIASVKQWLKIPVIGNGDIQTVQDIQCMFKETGCDRVMIGRALLAKPWLLGLVKGATQPDPFQEGAMYGRFLARVLELTREHYPEPLGARRFRFLVYFSSPYLEYGHTFYASIKNAENFDALEACIQKFFGENFDRPQKMALKTTLRF